MDNEILVIVGDRTYRFKLKSQSIVKLEKMFGKNIFEIFAQMSFCNIRTILWECLLNKEELQIDEDIMMDDIMSKYPLSELPDTLLTEIAVISGVLKKADSQEEMSAEEIKKD